MSIDAHNIIPNRLQDDADDRDVTIDAVFVKSGNLVVVGFDDKLYNCWRIDDHGDMFLWTKLHPEGFHSQRLAYDIAIDWD